MKRIGIIGVGRHSWEQHLPALEAAVQYSGGALELSAVCDLDRELAEKAASTFGFRNSFGNIEEMNRAVDLDGVVLVTPFEKTCSMAMELLELRVPLLIEKPPACDMDAAHALEHRRAELGVPVMVSMNRRHEARIRRLREIISSREGGSLDVQFKRVQRTEPYFLFETGIHFLDTIQYLCGSLASWSHVSENPADKRRCELKFKFESGTTGRVVVDPMAGSLEESYSYRNGDLEAEARFGDPSFPDSAMFRLKSGEKIIEEHSEDPGTPLHVRLGAQHETEVFLKVLNGQAEPEPSLQAVLPALEMAIELGAWSR